MAQVIPAPRSLRQTQLACFFGSHPSSPHISVFPPQALPAAGDKAVYTERTSAALPPGGGRPRPRTSQAMTENGGFNASRTTNWWSVGRESSFFGLSQGWRFPSEGSAPLMNEAPPPIPFSGVGTQKPGTEADCPGIGKNVMTEEARQQGAEVCCMRWTRGWGRQPPPPTTHRRKDDSCQTTTPPSVTTKPAPSNLQEETSFAILRFFAPFTTNVGTIFFEIFPPHFF